MIEIQIDKRIIEIAKSWSPDFQKNDYSIEHDDGATLMAGNYGEIIFQETYSKSERISHTDKQADFIYKKKRVEIKTKIVSNNPQFHHEVSISDYQKDFNCDIYFFYYYNKIKNTLWSLGWIEKSKFFQLGTKRLKGDMQKQGKGYTWIIKQDCYTLAISNLNKPTKP